MYNKYYKNNILSNNYNPIDRAAFTLFKGDTFSYKTFGPTNIPKYITLFGTRFLLTDWDVCILTFSTWSAAKRFQSQIINILQKEFRPYPLTRTVH
jgi:hypothetical protein